MSNFAKRVLVAAVAIPLALGIVWYGGLALALLVMVAAVLGTRELFDLSQKAGVRPLRGLGMALAALAPLATWLIASVPGDYGLSVSGPAPLAGIVELLAMFPAWLLSQWPLAAALVPIAVLLGVLWKRSPAEHPLAAAAATLFGPIYCGVLPSTLLVIRYAAGPNQSWPATWLVFFPLAITWLCDSFAMWGGMLIGGPKMAPSISPGKTRAGGIAGLVGGVLTAVLFVPLALAPMGEAIPLGIAAIMGLILAATAQVGDLAESLLKREAGVKDSGSLIPGHGGVLDRLDSLYFVLPMATLLFRTFRIL
ncbi:MAG TPA: CDP-archaeol synthase [Gemmatimonadales bacterium]|nr:CDP-archaeol synthase [Gemmatimonadales bacterium]